jgi:hypothetical protein
MVKLYVEGGGNSKALRRICSNGFSEFLQKTGLKGQMPRIVACGSRQKAYDFFCMAVNSGDNALLLVDSEAAVSADCQQGDAKNWKPWRHLKNRQGDQWNKPQNADDEDCHLMVQCMEAWFLIDRIRLQEFFGQGFNDTSLPSIGNPIESVAKKQVYQALSDATRNCKTKASYGKGEHSFKILKIISPNLIIAGSPWAKRFVDTVKKRMGG